MNLTELETQVLMFIGVSSVTSSGVTEPEVKAAINNVMPGIASEIEDLLTYCEYSTVASTQAYAVPEAYLTVKMVKLQTSASTWEVLEELDVKEFEDVTYGRANETGTPEHYKIERWATAVTNATQLPGDVWLFPIPDAVYTFRLYYYQRPTALSATTDVPELPIHWHMVICYRAAEIMAIKIKNYELARYLKVRGGEETEKALMASARPSRDEPKGIKESGYLVD